MWIGGCVVELNVSQVVVCILSIVGGVVCNLLPLHLMHFALAKCLPFDEAGFLYRRKWCADKQYTVIHVHVYIYPYLDNFMRKSES